MFGLFLPENQNTTRFFVEYICNFDTVYPYNYRLRHKIYRLSNFLNLEKKGSTGIGLANSRKIAELHQAKI